MGIVNNHNTLQNFFIMNRGEIEILNPLRINLIDAEFLDLEVKNILRGQISNILQFSPINLDVQYDTEIELFLNIIFYISTIGQNISTPGAMLLNIQYINNNTGSTSLTISQRICYLLGSTLYIWKKILNTYLLNKCEKSKILHRIIEQLECSCHVLNFFQFLYFLRFGGYRNVVERILNVRLTLKNIKIKRMIVYEPMNQQLFWESLTNFL